MFQLGSSLRQARLDRGLDLAQAEAETKIRTRYLGALEDERFDVLPAGSYGKHFLREYARFLGLDADVFAAELESRLPEVDAPIVSKSVRPRRRLRRPRLSVALVAGAVIVLVVILGAGAFSSGKRTPEQHVVGLQPRPSAHPAKHQVRPARVHKARAAHRVAKPAAPALARVTVKATRGDCWLEVRVGSAAGPLLYAGTLTVGHSLRYTRPAVWLRIGAPSALDVTLDGKPLASLPTATGNVLVTGRGAAAA